MGIDISKLQFPTKTPTSTASSKKMKLKLSTIKKTIKQQLINEKLSKKNFNNYIHSLLYKQTLPLLAFTHLSNSLFSLLDKDKRGFISETLFLKALCHCLLSEDFRTKAVFEVVKLSKTQQTIKINDLFNYYFESFISSLFLSHNVVGKNHRDVFTNAGVKVPSPTYETSLNYAKSKKDSIYNAAVYSLNEVNINKDNEITIDMFRKWCLKDNSIEITYGDKICYRYAMSLSFMNEFELEIDCDYV